jgi:hypothetical protein
MNRKLRRAEAKTGGPSVPALSAGVQWSFAEAFQRFQAGRFEEAERLFRQVLAVHPRHADSLHLLGIIAYQSKRNDLAVDLISKAIAIDPRNASSHSNLGNMFLQQGRPHEAIASYRKALDLSPKLTPSLNNLGNALKSQGRLDEAVAAYRKALDYAPDDPEIHYNLAMALLLRGDMESGWEEYEWRFKTPLFRTHREFAQPQWRGEEAAGKTLLVHAEQGFGDTLQFCRYAPLGSARGLTVILEAPEPIVRLLGSLPGVDRIVVQGEALPQFDLHCPMLSMPLAFGTDLATIPGVTPYLRADAAEVAAWRQRLDATGIQGPRIGLAWAGSPRKELIELAAVDGRRSIAPDLLSPLFELPGLRFFSLQKEGPAAPKHFPMIDLMEEMGDFADTAALVANLDLVISVDTSVAHLAGALGKPVWLLDRSDPCWRWLLGRRDNPWYPSLRIYRQQGPGDWDFVLAEVIRDLRRFAVGDG